MLLSRLFQQQTVRGDESSLLLPNDELRNDLVDEDGEDSVAASDLDALHDNVSLSRRRPLSGERFDDVPDSKRQLGERWSILVTRQFR
jgi:hypothetical protein